MSAHNERRHEERQQSRLKKVAGGRGSQRFRVDTAGGSRANLSVGWGTVMTAE